MAGEGVGEYAGSYFAPGMNPDIQDAIMESLMSMPQSAGDVAIGKALNLLDKKPVPGSDQVTHDTGETVSPEVQKPFSFESHEGDDTYKRWEEQINRQKEVQAMRMEPEDPTDTAIRGLYKANDYRMAGMESVPDYSMKGNANLLAKNISDYRRLQSQQASEEALNARQDRITSYNVCYTKLLRLIPRLLYGLKCR